MAEEPRLIRRPLITVDGELLIGVESERLPQLLNAPPPTR